MIGSPNQGRPVDAPLTNGPGERSPQALRNVCAQFEVLKNPRYARTPSATFCNIFLWDVTRALGCEIPHWIDDPKAPNGRRELTVNGTIEWLEMNGRLYGWRECDYLQAGEQADRGCPAVPLWKNPTGPHGHVAVCLPTVRGGLRIAQAGAANLFDAPLSVGFGLVKPIRFWTHE